MHPEPLDLNRVTGGMSALLTSTIGGTTRIEMRPAAELWLALADAAQIELVLLNLAINARDAMPEGGTITVSTAQCNALGAAAAHRRNSAGLATMSRSR